MNQNEPRTTEAQDQDQQQVVPPAASSSSATQQSLYSSLLSSRRQFSPNVYKAVLFNLANGIAFSVWYITVFPVLIYRLANNSNSYVGWMAGIAGLSQLVVAFGSGALERRFKRQVFCRMGATLGCLAVAVTCVAIHTEQIWLFFCSMVLWGGYQGANNTSIESLFADSIPSLHREGLYTAKWIVQTMSYTVGYLMSIILFQKTKNHWDKDVLDLVMYVGVGIHPVAFLILTLLRDADTLGAESESLLHRPDSRDHRPDGQDPIQHVSNGNSDAKTSSDDTTPIATKVTVKVPTASTIRITSGVSSPYLSITGNTSFGGLSAANEEPNNSDQSASNGNTSSSNEQAGGESLSINNNGNNVDDAPSSHEQENAHENPQKNWWCCSSLCSRVKREHIPYFVVAGDVTLSMGAGMTIRYLPLFFINIYNLSPTTMSATLLTISVVTAAAAQLVKIMSRSTLLGRVRSVIIVRMLGCLGLYYLGLIHGEGKKIVPMLIVYVLRSALMNSTRGITRTILMDYVPKRNRVRWNAMESVASFSWCGSAALGGYLADAHGYRFTFVITAVIQTISFLLLFPVISIVEDSPPSVVERRRRGRSRKSKSKKEQETMQQTGEEV